MVTNIDGEFVLKVAPGAKITITCVGYSPQTIPATDGMTVVLKEEAEVLQAVEVVAYGVQKKVTVTGAISSVKSDDLVRTPVRLCQQRAGRSAFGCDHCAVFR